MTEVHTNNQLDDATFRGLLEAAPDGILLVNRNGVIVFANSPCANIFGYAVTELVGQYIELIVPEYIRGKHASLRNRYFESPHSRPMGIGLDLVAARKDGSAIPVEISLSPFKFEGQDGAIAVVRDVTDQRRLQRELKRSNEELEQFAYVASHDLQEPLRMVSGYTQLLKRRHADKLNTEAGEYIDYAVNGVMRMQALITDLLAFSRLSSRPKEFKPIDMNDVMQQAISNVQAAIAESSAVITTDKLPIVMGDRTQLIQLVQNLLSNSIKFHSAGVKPEIHIKIVRDGGQWKFSLADNGIGIDAEYRDKVFVIFQRLHARDKYPGTGIGLSICKKIVERHHGRIWIEPTPPPGTTFTFTLPGAEGSK